MLYACSIYPMHATWPPLLIHLLLSSVNLTRWVPKLTMFRISYPFSVAWVVPKNPSKPEALFNGEESSVRPTPKL